MTAAPGSDVQAVCLEIVTEEPGSTGTDVRVELSARGITMSLPAVSQTLAALTRRRLTIRQKMVVGGRVHLCYRPNPEGVPHGEEEADP